MRPKISRQIDRLDGDAARLIEALRVAHGVEGRGTRADGADAQILQSLDDAANAGEPGQIGGELRRREALGMQRGQRVGNLVLHQVVTGAHLAAEAVAADGDGHLFGAVGRGLHQHRNPQAAEADGVHNAALFAEVGQSDDDAVNLVGMLFEELGAAFAIPRRSPPRRTLNPQGQARQRWRRPPPEP